MVKPAETLIILTPAFPKNHLETIWLPPQQILVKELKSQFPQLNIIVLSFLYPYTETEYDWHNIKIIPFDGMHKRKLRRLQLWRNIWRKLNESRKAHNVIGILSFW